MNTSRKGGWSRRPGGVCSSEKTTEVAIRGFYDFLLEHSDCSKEYRLAERELSMSLLADADLLADYVKYLIDGGWAKNDPIRLIAFIDEVIRDNGFLRLGVTPLNNMTVPAWESHLDALIAYLPHLKNSMQNNSEPKRDGKFNILFLLDMEQDEMRESVDRIISKLSTYDFSVEGSVPTRKDLRGEITSLILQLSRVCPLRITNWSELKLIEASGRFFDKSEPALVWFKDKGNYRIVVPKRFQKNRGREGLEDINTLVPDVFRGNVERFLKLRALCLSHYGGEDEGFVFFKLKSNHPGVMAYKSVGANKLSTDFQGATKEVVNALFPDVNSRGINPHAARHLAASEYLNDFPDNYPAVAVLLNDSLKVVLDTYAKLDHKKHNALIL